MSSVRRTQKMQCVELVLKKSILKDESQGVHLFTLIRRTLQLRFHSLFSNAFTPHRKPNTFWK